MQRFWEGRTAVQSMAAKWGDAAIQVLELKTTQHECEKAITIVFLLYRTLTFCCTDIFTKKTRPSFNVYDHVACDISCPSVQVMTFDEAAVGDAAVRGPAFRCHMVHTFSLLHCVAMATLRGDSDVTFPAGGGGGSVGSGGGRGGEGRGRHYQQYIDKAVRRHFDQFPLSVLGEIGEHIAACEKPHLFVRKTTPLPHPPPPLSLPPRPPITPTIVCE